MRTPKSRDLQLTIDPLSSTPLYQQVYESIRQQIIEGALTEGDYLPSIKGATETHSDDRSEERRVGKECRSRWSPYH